MARHAFFVLLLAIIAASLALPAATAVAREPRGDGARQGRLAYPPPPRDGYRPSHVRQLYNNCAFASAQMLIDKWTGGRRAAPQQLLRRATGIPSEEGGPTLGQLRRAVAEVSGIDLRWSPNGGDPLTWPELLARLEDGGGALVNVWPEKLPRHYRRWLPTLTAGHSVYVERYDFRRNRIWIMDPLGRGSGFRGEWIDADTLHRAMWHAGKLVWAAATPPSPEPRPPALSDFELGTPETPSAAFASDPIEIAIPYAARRSDATLPALRLAGVWERVDEPPAAEPDDAAVLPGALGSADNEALPSPPLPLPLDDVVQRVNPLVASPEELALATTTDPYAGQPGTGPFETLSDSLTTAEGWLLSELTGPTEPGEYLLTLELRNGDGQPPVGEAPSFKPIAVRVRGPLAGRVRIEGVPPADARQGDVLSIDLKATNLGSAGWGEGGAVVALMAAFDGDAGNAPVPLALAAGDATVLTLSVRVETHPGPRTLRLSLVDAAGERLPESEPLELLFNVTPEERHATAR